MNIVENQPALVHVSYMTSYVKDYDCPVTISGRGYVNIVLLFQAVKPNESASSGGYKI
jgi:hypothetical protein